MPIILLILFLPDNLRPWGFIPLQPFLIMLSECSLVKVSWNIFVKLLIGFVLLQTATAQTCTLLIAAAADLSILDPELKRALPNCDTRITYGSSGTLARQIEAGADFDLFLAASRAFAE